MIVDMSNMLDMFGVTEKQCRSKWWGKVVIPQMAFPCQTTGGASASGAPSVGLRYTTEGKRALGP